MRYNHYSLEIQISTDGGRSWGGLADAVFEYLIKEWSASRIEVLEQLARGEVVQSPHQRLFCYRAVKGQMPLDLV